MFHTIQFWVTTHGLRAVALAQELLLQIRCSFVLIMSCNFVIIDVKISWLHHLAARHGTQAKCNVLVSHAVLRVDRVV
jgi:hypothetical protein